MAPPTSNLQLGMPCLLKKGKNDQDTQNHINNINEFSDKYLTINPDYDTGIGSTIGIAAGEVVRDTWGYVFAPKFATQTYNEVFSEEKILLA